MSITNNRTPLGALFLSFTLLAACNIEDSSESSEDEESLGTAEQPFTGWVGTGTRIAVNGQNINVLLGGDTNTAGFLTAVAGNMYGGAAHITTDLGVNHDQMQFLLGAGANATFRADAALVAPGEMTNGKAFSTNSGVREERLGWAGNALRRCYIKSVCGGVTQQQFFNSADDSIAIVKNPDNYYYLRMTGSACGSAACMLVSQPGAWVANGPGTYYLGPADQGRACWLTGLAGSFRNNNASDGVVLRTIVPSPGASPIWQLVVSNNKWGGAECAK